MSNNRRMFQVEGMKVDLDELIAQRNTVLKAVGNAGPRSEANHLDGVINLLEAMIDIGLDRFEGE